MYKGIYVTDRSNKKDMRNTFVNTLLELAKKDPGIMILTGDLGYSVFEKFQEELPKQYLNMGVAEQNMIGVAAGLAMEGRIPFVYSIVPFVTMRPFEQIRNDVCYQNVNVKIVGVGAGFSYGPYGHTHHGLEDIGILRTLPNMTIIAPGDPVEVKLATKALVKHTGPAYLRLGKAGEPNIHSTDLKFQIGKGIVVSEGSDITIIATSTMLKSGYEVIRLLKDMKISARLISMHTIKPIDEKLIIESAKKTKTVVTIEEHSIIGGLGSAVADVISESGVKTKFKRIGVPDRFTKAIGLQEYMRHANLLTISDIVQTVKNLFLTT